MNWEQLGQQWQSLLPKGNGREGVEDIKRRDLQLRRQVRRRDALESGIAALLAPVFGVAAWFAAVYIGAWPAFFCALLATWCLYVPLHLWRQRRLLPDPDAGMPLRDFLEQQQRALLGQARMLETAWAWYVGPCAVGVAGLFISIGGLDRRVLFLLAAMLAMFIAIAWLNRRVARTHFRAAAARLAQELQQLDDTEAC